MSSRGVDLAGQKRSDKAMLGDSGFARVEGDRYYTEPWVTRALLDAVKFRGLIWEPACGRGDMANVLAQYDYKVMVSDISGRAQGCPHAFEADFLTHSAPAGGVFSVITNPPYTRAEEFIRHALALTARDGGMVAMLLRNEYDCAVTRRDLFERAAFAAKLVLTRRPRWFDGLARYSACPRHNFAWYVWDHLHSGSAVIRWIPLLRLQEPRLPLRAGR